MDRKQPGAGGVGQRRARVAAVVAVVVALLVPGQPPAANAQAGPAGDRAARLAGPSRIETAVAIAQHAFPEGGSRRAEAVYLARADVFADALAAGALVDGPILLVPSCGAVPPSVSQEVERLDPDRVIALGGEAAVCGELLLEAAGGRPAGRLSGASRFDTAVAIARAAFPDGADVAYVARATDSPDAVAGGALTDGPILLVPSAGDIPAPVLQEIARLDPRAVVALGGRSSVGEDVLEQAARERERGRIAGPSRIDTAAAIAAIAFPTTAQEVYLARADVFADAVAAGSLTRGPILLVPRCGEVPEPVVHAIRRLEVERVVALGGPAAVCQTLLDTAAGLAAGATAIPDTTVVLDAPARAALLEQTGEMLRFSTPGAPELEPGDVIVSDVVPGVAPQGLLREVIAVEMQDGQTLVETTRAAITDAVAVGYGALEVTLDPSTIVSQRFLHPAVQPLARPQSTSRATDVNVPLVSLDISEQVILHDRDGDAATQDDQVAATGRFALSAELNAELDIEVEGLFPPRPHVEVFQATVDVAQSAGLVVTAREAATWQPEPIELWEAELRCFRMQLGYVPVLLCPEIEVSLHGNGNVVASATVGVRQDASGSFGAAYRDGSWSPVAERTFDAGVDPSPTFTANADVHGALRAALTIELYDVDGPYIYVDLFGRGEAEQANERFCVGAYAGIAAGVGLEFDDVPVLGDDMPAFPEREVLSHEVLLFEDPVPHRPCGEPGRFQWSGTLTSHDVVDITDEEGDRTTSEERFTFTVVPGTVPENVTWGGLPSQKYAATVTFSGTATQYNASTGCSSTTTTEGEDVPTFVYFVGGNPDGTTIWEIDTEHIPATFTMTHSCDDDETSEGVMASWTTSLIMEPLPVTRNAEGRAQVQGSGVHENTNDQGEVTRRITVSWDFVS